MKLIHLRHSKPLALMLATSVLYYAEADFGDAATNGKPTLPTAAWVQYPLDNFATVAEAFKFMTA